MRIKGLLCDLDGTLVESNWLHASAWRDAFAEMGIELELDAVRRQIGKGGDELIPVFVPWWRRVAVQEPLKKLRSHIFATEYMHQVKPLPRAKEFLERVRGAGIQVALASSASQADLETYKRLLDVDHVVGEETSSTDAKQAKPHPDIFEASLRKLGMKASEVLALGDTPWDAESAGLAGISTVGVETGGWSHKDLLDAGCVEVWKSVEELLEHFEESAFCR